MADRSPRGSLAGRLALAFAAVALLAVAALAAVMLLVTRSETGRLSAADRDRTATQVTRELAAAYRSAGSWDGADLSAAVALAANADAALVVRDESGQEIVGGRIGRGPPAGRGQGHTQLARPIEVDGRRVGGAELRFRGALSQTQSVLRDKLVQAVLLGSAIALLIALAGSVLVTRRIARPLQRLAEAARRLEAGDLAARAGDDSGPGELGELARAFDGMAETLEREAGARRRLVSDLSHEVRTPVAILRGNLEELVDEVEDATPDRLASLHDEVLRLGALVDQLDLLAQADAPIAVIDRAPVGLAELVRSQLATLRPQLEGKHLRLESRLEEVTVAGDRARLGQVVANLLSNSLKFTPEGGLIEVAVGTSDGAARITVADSGPGIPESERAHVFDRFWRGSAANGVSGRGIGLAVAADIVHAHRGRIEVGSADTGGASFVVTLPAT